MNGFDIIRDWLFSIRFTMVVVIGFVICVLFPICAKPLGEGGVLLEVPFFALWLTTCGLVVAHVHRVVAHFSNALLQFGTPIAGGILYATLTIGAGGAVGFWIAMRMLPA